VRLTECVFGYDELRQASALREMARAMTEELTCMHDADWGG
jgi:hypothetical protein